MTCKNIMLKLATILPALSLSLTLGNAQQQNLEGRQDHSADRGHDVPHLKMAHIS